MALHDPAAGEWPRASAAGLSFRPVAGADRPFLAEVYAATRRDELAPVPWSDEQKAAFLRMQFDAQHRHYQQHYRTAHFLVIERDGARVGRLYLDHWRSEHRLIDLALLPQARGRGFGSAMLRDLIDAAAAAGKPLSIHVEINNPAMRLYRRLGFQATGSHGLYALMVVSPPAPPQANTA